MPAISCSQRKARANRVNVPVPLTPDDLLKESQLAAFEEQMNMPEWFGFVVDRRNCSADALGDYNFLATEDKNNWDNNSIIPHGSKASKIGCKHITNRYNDLDIIFSEDAICR